MHEITARKGARTGSFEFDESAIYEICKKLVNSINERFWNGRKINARGRQKLSVKSPIDGKIHKLNFRLKQVLDHEEFLNGSKASWSYPEQEIVFSVPDEFLWFAHTSDVWISQFYQNFIHELTHVFDIKGNEDYVRGNYTSAGDFHDSDNVDRIQKYYTDPAEIKAYLSQVTQEMIWNIQENPSIQDPEKLLNLSQTWQYGKKHWEANPKIVKLFLRSAFDVFSSYRKN